MAAFRFEGLYPAYSRGVFGSVIPGLYHECMNRVPVSKYTVELAKCEQKCHVLPNIVNYMIGCDLS